MFNSKKALLFFCFLAACSSKTNQSNTFNQLVNPGKIAGSQQVDFSNFGDAQWTQVCFFAPYTSKGQSASALGFDWEVTEETDIETNDRINVVVFATNTEVTEYLSIPINKISRFQNATKQCVARSNAIFTFENTSYIYRTK